MSLDHAVASAAGCSTFWIRSMQPNGGTVMTVSETPEPVRCEWFALCPNEATTTVSHPILGDVPVCDRCVEKLGLQPTNR